MASQVNPVQARRGRWIQTFKIEEKQGMLSFCRNMEEMLKRQGKDDTHKIVYTRIGMGTQERRYDTWQVFVVKR